LGRSADISTYQAPDAYEHDALSARSLHCFPDGRHDTISVVDAFVLHKINVLAHRVVRLYCIRAKTATDSS